MTLVTSLVVLGVNEFYGLAVQKVTKPERVVGTLASSALCVIVFFFGVEYVWLVIAIALFLLGTSELFRNQLNPILNLATNLMGMFYVAFSLCFLILIREIPRETNLDYSQGGRIMILVFLAIWVCDTMAYVLGSQLGRHKLFERVSPNKTVEGTILGFVFAVVTGYICQLTFLNDMRLMDVLAVSVICGSVGQVSDLLESLLKRDAKVKDSSNLIPGHGGILDRFDSEILAAPAVYLYLKFVAF